MGYAAGLDSAREGTREKLQREHRPPSVAGAVAERLPLR